MFRGFRTAIHEEAVFPCVFSGDEFGERRKSRIDSEPHSAFEVSVLVRVFRLGCTALGGTRERRGSEGDLVE